MTLATMQRDIERLNDVSCSLDVRDFVFSDRETLGALAPTDFSTDRPEALLVTGNTESLEISLFIDAEVVAALDNDDTNGEREGAHWHAAAEGVSHFVYVAWSARHGRRVSALELELQAEVDRYALARLAVADSPNGAAAVHEGQFQGTTLREGLCADERARYAEAGDLACGVTAWLERECMAQAGRSAFVTALRRFYRLPRERKIAASRALLQGQIWQASRYW